MDCLTTSPLLLLFLFLSLFTSSSTANFEVHNNCPFTVWAAETLVGSGQRLDQGQSWIINAQTGMTTARIWGRTNCKFDHSGRGSCQTGDCGGVLNCTGWGKAPNTLAEFTLNQYDISLFDGFNIPVSIAPIRPSAEKCGSISCTADIVGQCPGRLRVPGGCGAPCDPTDYSSFFETTCPDADSYTKDDDTNTFTCPGGSTDYRVVFCP